MLEEKTLKTRNDFIGQIVISHLETLGLSEQPNFPDEPLIDLVPRIAQYPFELSEDEVWDIAHWSYSRYQKQKQDLTQERQARKARQTKTLKVAGAFCALAVVVIILIITELIYPVIVLAVGALVLILQAVGCIIAAVVTFFVICAIVDGFKF